MPKHVVGLDIGTYTIKATQGDPGKIVKLEKAIAVPNPLGIQVPSDDINSEKLSQVIDNMFNDNALNRLEVRLSLPESVVSTKIISIPALTDAELASAITWQAEQHIPIPLDELALEYQVVYRPERYEKNEEMRVLMVGVRKSIIDKIMQVFLRIGIEPTLLETQTISVLRSLQFTAEDPNTLIVHGGAFHTDMMVVSHGELRFVFTQPTGGQALTRAIEQAAQLDGRQAEEYKRTYGLDPTQIQGKVREILLPPVKTLLLDMQKAMQFFVSDAHEEPIKRVLLSGGTAQLPGLVQYITEQLGVEVLIAAPFAAATPLPGVTLPADQPAYTVCMGLLMREAGA